MKRPRASASTFGLIAWLEQTQVQLPLRAVECRFAVSGPAVDVQIDQVFQQTAGHPLDVTYTFPLPSRAAVYRCEMIVNGRVIRARVEEQEAARRLAAQRKSEGRRTALVEMERGNVFTLSLGNVQSGDVIVIRFAYIEELDAWKDEWALQIPFSPGIRYIPGEPLLRSNSGKGTADDTDQVPDASRITPPRIDQLHPDAARLFLSGTLDSRDADLASISSPTHPTAVRPSEGVLEIFLPANASVPDRDFVLRWRRGSRSDLVPSAWISTEETAAYALIQLRAPDDIPAVDACDVYFLVDRSGSMAGAKWEKTAEALKAFVKAAAPADRIWITFFESGYRDFAEKPLGRDALLADSHFQTIEELGTGGDTKLLPALRHVLEVQARFPSDRRSHIVLITDGQIGNENAVLREVAGRPLPVHCFGIDHAINEAFLRDVAARQRGTCAFLTPDDDLVRPIGVLGSQLGRPVLTELALTAGWELADGNLPDLYAGQVAFASAIAGAPAPALIVTGKNSVGELQTITLQPEAVSSGLPKLLYMKRLIDALLHQNRGAEAIAVAKEANLVCRGAAFIAWDETEKVPVAQQEVYQPSVIRAELSLATMRSAREAYCFFGSSATEYRRKANLKPCSDEELVEDLLLPQELQLLIRKMHEVMSRILGPENTRKFVTIIEEWAKNAVAKQVEKELAVLETRCTRHTDSDAIRRELVAFFSNLPEPWRSKALALLVADKASPVSSP